MHYDLDSLDAVQIVRLCLAAGQADRIEGFLLDRASANDVKRFLSVLATTKPAATPAASPAPSPGQVDWAALRAAADERFRAQRGGSLIT